MTRGAAPRPAFVADSLVPTSIRSEDIHARAGLSDKSTSIYRRRNPLILSISPALSSPQILINNEVATRSNRPLLRHFLRRKGRFCRSPGSCRTAALLALIRAPKRNSCPVKTAAPSNRPTRPTTSFGRARITFGPCSPGRPLRPTIPFSRPFDEEKSALVIDVFQASPPPLKRLPMPGFRLP